MDNESTTQQEISTETTPAQEVSTSTTETSQSTQEGQSKETTAPISEDWEYNGDRKSVPKEFQKYSAGFDRYASKKDQAIAEFRKKAEELDSFRNSEDFKAYQQYIATKQKETGTSKIAERLLTEEEAAAISVGDTATLEQVIQRGIDRGIDAKVGPKEAEINKKFAAMDLKEKQIQNAEMIKSFADVNPDFWELYETVGEDYVIASIKSGKSIEEMYKSAKEVEGRMNERLDAKRKADFEKKKAGTVVGKSIPGTPDVVFADNEDQAKKLAAQLTLKGDKRHVRIKPKK